MRKMLIAALVVPVALLGAARPAKAGDTAAAVLAGVAVGIGAALILDALIPRPVVAAPAVFYPPPPPPVVYQPAPVVVTPPPVMVMPAPVVYRTPPPVVVHKTVIVKGPRARIVHKPHPVYVTRNPYGY